MINSYYLKYVIGEDTKRSDMQEIANAELENAYTNVEMSFVSGSGLFFTQLQVQ